MSKVYSTPGKNDGPLIDRKLVSDFFEKRAEKISTIGHVQAVIYQDKNPKLAEDRNILEKVKLLPLLRMDGTQRLLDIGCGAGRWAEELLPVSGWYHGIDACAGLVAHAGEQFAAASNSRFTIASVDAFSLKSLEEPVPFDRVLCAGVLMYLNDDEIQQALHCIWSVLAPGGLLLVREPFGVERRLTLSEHYSDDMEQVYSAIYRTRQELEELIRMVIPEEESRLVGCGDVYDEPELNNRDDTKQQWLLLERTYRWFEAG